MKQKLIIASETIASSRTGSPCCFQICALCEDRRMIEASVQPEKSESILNNIYIGRVKNIASNINAAFVEIAPGITGYYSLTENRRHWLGDMPAGGYATCRWRI